MEPITYAHNAAKLQAAGNFMAATFWMVVVLAMGALAISIINRRRDP